MAVTRISGVRLAGIASAVPVETRTIFDEAKIFGAEDAEKISRSIGVKQRHVVPADLCTSDLCFAAASKLLADLQWSSDSVEALVFVSQTPDYLLPATSCVLHGRLGLSKHCAAFDLNLGCSGYVYGLWIASQIVASGTARRTLLLVGDTISRIVSPQDRSSAPLFGDAGTATALEAKSDAQNMFFSLGTDGNGQNHLIVPAGGFRQPSNQATKQRRARENSNIRSDEDLFMNGAEVFAFTLREVPALVDIVINGAGWQKEQVDAFVFHQANRFMLQHLTKRMRIPEEKVVLTMEEYGNTSSASIPLAMTHSLQNQLSGHNNQLVLAGFGVGFSWGAVALSCGNMLMPNLIYLPDKQLIDQHE